MRIFDSNKVVHATCTAGASFWNVTECKGPDGCVYIVQRHCEHEMSAIVAEFATKRKAINYAEKKYRTDYEKEVGRLEDWKLWRESLV